MKWLVQLTGFSDSDEKPDFIWSKGTVIEDRRSGAFDLIHKACKEMGGEKSLPRKNEVWEISRVYDAGKWVVQDDGTLREA